MSSQSKIEFPQPKHGLLGTVIQFLSSPEGLGADIGLIAGSIPAGVAVPLHSHVEPEAICVLDGTLDVYRETGPDAGWKQAIAGEVVLIPGNVKHALHNKGESLMTSIFATQGKLYKFFLEVSVPAAAKPGPPTMEQLQKVLGTSEAYGYWMGTPQDNAAIGLELPPPA